MLLMVASISSSNLVKNLYYNPTEISHTQYLKDFDMVMYALYELNSPEYESLLTIVDDMGYGRYNIVLTKYNTFKTKEERQLIELKRDNVTGLYDQMLDNKIRALNSSEDFGEDDYNLLLNELKKENNYASVFVTFEETMSLKEGLSHIDENNNLIFKWMSFDHGEKYDHMTLGFVPYKSSEVSFGESPDSTIYPMFFLNQAFSKTTDKTLKREDLLVYNHELHLKTLLKYLANERQSLSIFNINSNGGDLYINALDYINNNGVNISGVLVYGETLNIVKFIENENIGEIQILDMKVSKYSK